MRFIEIGISGRIVRASAIELFSADKIGDWRTLVAQGQQELGGVSSGLGLYGSAGWVIAGSLLLGALEKSASNANAKKGLGTLARADALLSNLRDGGRFFGFDQVDNIELPEPSRWTSLGVKTISIDMSNIGFLDRGPLLKRYGKDKSDIVSGYLYVQKNESYIALGEDFISLRLENESLLRVRWSSVDTFKIDDSLAYQRTEA